MIKSETVLHLIPGVRMSAFPTAMMIRFSVSFHDDVGVQFYSTSSRVRFRLHKYVMCLLINFLHFITKVCVLLPAMLANAGNVSCCVFPCLSVHLSVVEITIEDNFGHS